jgi:hypothetical protein
MVGDIVHCVACNTSGTLENQDVWHPYMHAIRTEGGSLKTAEVEVKHQQDFPVDPVLRQALMDKGVLAPDDLRAAEQKIKATTGGMTVDVSPGYVESPLEQLQEIPVTHGN